MRILNLCLLYGANIRGSTQGRTRDRKARIRFQRPCSTISLRVNIYKREGPQKERSLGEKSFKSQMRELCQTRPAAVDKKATKWMHVEYIKGFVPRFGKYFSLAEKKTFFSARDISRPSNDKRAPNGLMIWSALVRMSKREKQSKL